MKKKLISLILLLFLLPEFTFASSIFSNFKEGVFVFKAEVSEAVKGTSSFFKEYFQWLGENFLATGKKIKNFGLGIKENAIEGIKGVGEKISKVPGLFKKKEVKKLEVQKEATIPKEIQEKISSLEEKIKELEARPPQIKEVEKEVERKVVVQPIKEVEKITEFIPSDELAKIKSQLSIFGETLRKIQPNPPYTSALTSPIYIQQGIQGGAGIFASLAAESAAFRTLGVGASVTLGSDSRDKLTINSVSQFNAPITIGQNALTIDTSGNIKTQGSAEIAGNLITQGLTEFKSPFTLTSTSTPSTLNKVRSIKQTRHLSFLNRSSEHFLNRNYHIICSRQCQPISLGSKRKYWNWNNGTCLQTSCPGFSWFWNEHNSCLVCECWDG